MALHLKINPYSDKVSKPALQLQVLSVEFKIEEDGSQVRTQE